MTARYVGKVTCSGSVGNTFQLFVLYTGISPRSDSDDNGSESLIAKAQC
jgi:hypothetical protein